MGAQDNVFVNFVDHGGVGIVELPNGPYLKIRSWLAPCRPCTATRCIRSSSSTWKPVNLAQCLRRCPKTSTSTPPLLPMPRSLRGGHIAPLQATTSTAGPLTHASVICTASIGWRIQTLSQRWHQRRWQPNSNSSRKKPTNHTCSNLVPLRSLPSRFTISRPRRLLSVRSAAPQQHPPPPPPPPRSSILLSIPATSP